MMPAQMRVKTSLRGYGKPHQRTRAQLEPMVLSGGVRCWRCGEPIGPGDPWDLGHVDGDPSRYAGPEHAWCNRATAGRRSELSLLVEVPERDGLDASDPRWDVPWLKGLRRVPRDATWPRLMTVPHPWASGSLGKEFVAWADRRTPHPLRWWQRLAATRFLEHDGEGRLVWDAAILSMARQLGKSWLLRELCLWRIEQGDRFGEAQDVLHTGKDLAVCVEVQRSARLWAKPLAEYLVREANGEQRVEYLPAPGGRWMVKAKGAPYGFSASMAVADEAWNVETSYIEEGVAPTMVERQSPQLLLVSTAHRLSSSLMLTRRKAALEQLESGDGDLLVEWSAPRGAPIDDLGAWRLASPHWTAHRQKLIQRRLDAMYAGETQDVTESDPAESFRAQWLNQWPRGLTIMVGEELLPPGLWDGLAEPVESDGPLYVAIEDNFGNGAAVAVAAKTADGRIEVDGGRFEDWDSAVEYADRLGSVRRVRQLLVGASMFSRMPPGTAPAPRPAGGAETRPGLPLLRDLAAGGMLVHDVTTRELDEAVASARVKEGAAGLVLVPHGRTDLVRALVWAVGAAHKPTPEPAVY